MKRTIEINYNYDTSELSYAERTKHVGEMEDNAMGHILEMVLEGFTSGDLCYGFTKDTYTKDTKKSMVEVHGTWEYKSINKDLE